MADPAHDPLTGLPDRTLLLDRLEHALARVERTGMPVAVLFCNLDGFKKVNSALGRAAGDELLVGVARRIATCVRPADSVARLGGDEFAVVLEELRDPGDAARAAERILRALETPFDLSAREVYAGASIGIATRAASAETLLRDADLAMHRAKREGRGRYALFEPRLHAEVVEQLELEHDLKRAIDGDKLELVYQPIFSLRTGLVAGLEALVRWRHPARGPVSPEEFIPLAEESGQIHALGQWVLDAACHQAALWRARYPGFPGLRVGVNVSGAQLREPEFVDRVRGALSASQLDPTGLTLEITESVLIDDTELATGKLEELKRIGVDLAIDDFGIGYSSLTYLQRFPLDDLKIDRTFVERVGTRSPEPALVRAIVDLAEIFDLRPIAEGVSRPEQADRLLELGCELGQGYLLAEPLSAADADALLLGVGLLGAPGPATGSSLGSRPTDEESEPAGVRDPGRARRGDGGSAGAG
ncbi:MAG TPA: EAL domain-containing protein [Solirubrobacterales bacterium]|nr:EAL domain-containing protein [Solirubrobacterales bacterium]